MIFSRKSPLISVRKGKEKIPGIVLSNTQKHWTVERTSTHTVFSPLSEQQRTWFIEQQIAYWSAMKNNLLLQVPASQHDEQIEHLRTQGYSIFFVDADTTNHGEILDTMKDTPTAVFISPDSPDTVTSLLQWIIG